ncbi:MAG: type II secretion system protein [Sulfuricella sp.]|nr:type II secretion system protein [Sulfuricella sp.]
MIQTGSQHKPSQGFTYIGLLIFVAILGISSASTITIGSSMQRRSQEEELLYIGRQFSLAFKSYYETSAATPPYPSTLQELVRDPRVPSIRRHLRKIFADPLTGSEDWGIILTPEGRISGVYSKSNAAPIKKAQFDPDQLALEGKNKYSEWVFGYASFSSKIVGTH